MIKSKRKAQYFIPPIAFVYKKNYFSSKNVCLRCIEQYLDIYNEEVLRDELTRVNNQLTDMNPNIPPGWKLLGVKAENVTRLNLLEVAENVKSWIEISVSREAALTANSQKVINGVALVGTNLNILKLSS